MDWHRVSAGIWTLYDNNDKEILCRVTRMSGQIYDLYAVAETYKYVATFEAVNNTQALHEVWKIFSDE